MIPVTLQTAFAVAVAGGCFVLCSVIAAQQRRLSALERKLQHEAATRESEHSGRISAEKASKVFQDVEKELCMLWTFVGSCVVTCTLKKT